MKTQSAKIWEKYTDAVTFSKIRDMDSVAQMWESCVKEYADRIAVSDNGETYSFSRIDEEVKRYRTQFADLDKGDRVVLLIPNSYEFVRAFLAVTTLGLTAVILPVQLDPKAVFGCCMKFGAKKLVYQKSMQDKIDQVLAIKPDLCVVKAEEIPEEETDAAFVAGTDPCVIMFTGGTTGKSKGVLLSNAAVMQGTVNGCYGYKDVFFQRYLLILPLSHVFGLIRNLMTSLYTGSDLFICRDNKDMFRDIAAFRPTAMVMVPALAEMALNLSAKFGRNMLGDDLKTIICGAAPVAPYLVGAYHEKGIALLPGYGLTESANLVSGNPESLRLSDSVGLMFPNQEYRIEDGELWLKGRNMLEGYVGEEENDSFEDGWFKTGDLARVDEEGYLYITGRIKEIIVLPSGENVSPAEVEAYFNALEFVQDSQVFEDQNDRGETILALEIVPRQTVLAKLQKDDPAAYMMEKLGEVNRTLPAYCQIGKIVIRDQDFERSPSMKIVRYKK